MFKQTVRQVKNKQRKQLTPEEKVNRELQKKNKLLDGLYMNDELSKEFVAARDYICGIYCLTSCSAVLMKKIRSIIDGSYTDKDGINPLKEPISAEMLENLYNFNWDKLESIHQRINNGTGFISDESKICYDLAIVTASYPHYKKILEQQAEYHQI